MDAVYFFGFLVLVGFVGLIITLNVLRRREREAGLRR